MDEPPWLTADSVCDAHSGQLVIFGGPDGIRDVGLLEPALDRPRNKWAYGETDLASLAAAYGFGLSRNHPFIDGNKRTVFTAILMFLGLYGMPFKAPPPEASAAMLALASGTLDEEGLARWIRRNVEEQRAD